MRSLSSLVLSFVNAFGLRKIVDFCAPLKSLRNQEIYITGEESMIFFVLVARVLFAVLTVQIAQHALFRSRVEQFCGRMRDIEPDFHVQNLHHADDGTEHHERECRRNVASRHPLKQLFDFALDSIRPVGLAGLLVLRHHRQDDFTLPHADCGEFRQRLGEQDAVQHVYVAADMHLKDFMIRNQLVVVGVLLVRFVNHLDEPVEQRRRQAEAAVFVVERGIGIISQYGICSFDVCNVMKDDLHFLLVVLGAHRVEIQHEAAGRGAVDVQHGGFPQRRSLRCSNQRSVIRRIHQKPSIAALAHQHRFGILESQIDLRQDEVVDVAGVEEDDELVGHGDVHAMLAFLEDEIRVVWVSVLKLVRCSVTGHCHRFHGRFLR